MSPQVVVRGRLKGLKSKGNITLRTTHDSSLNPWLVIKLSKKIFLDKIVIHIMSHEHL